jgi:uncharacterized membrane protein (DUF485 family)
MNDGGHRLAELTRAQWRLALLLTAAMMGAYFGFILLVAYNKALLGTLLGVLVIVLAWVLINVYVRWANGHYDTTVASLRKER